MVTRTLRLSDGTILRVAATVQDGTVRIGLDQGEQTIDLAPAASVAPLPPQTPTSAPNGSLHALFAMLAHPPTADAPTVPSPPQPPVSLAAEPPPATPPPATPPPVPSDDALVLRDSYDTPFLLGPIQTID